MKQPADRIWSAGLFVGSLAHKMRTGTAGSVPDFKMPLLSLRQSPRCARRRLAAQGFAGHSIAFEAGFAPSSSPTQVEAHGTIFQLLRKMRTGTAGSVPVLYVLEDWMKRSYCLLQYYLTKSVLRKTAQVITKVLNLQREHKHSESKIFLITQGASPLRTTFSDIHKRETGSTGIDPALYC